MRHVFRTACAVALLAAGFAAQAGTVKFTDWAYGKGNAVKVSSPHGGPTTPLDAMGGAFSVTLSGFADSAFNTSFEAYCVELSENISIGSSYTSYQLFTAADYFAAKPGVATALTSLISHVNNTNLLANTVAGFRDEQSTALQLAIWNMVYDSDSTLSGGAFRELGNTAFRNDGAPNKFLGADSLLAGYGSASGYSLYVLRSDSVGTRAGQQDQLIWMRNQVPEPSSLALVALALGGMGFVSRRRKR